MHGTTAADLMTRDVATVTPDASIRELAELMHDHRVHGVPVVEDGRVVGVVSSSDVLWFAERVDRPEPAPPDYDPWDHLDEFRVRDIMTADYFGVSPSATLDELRRFFERTGVHRALVLDGESLVGIVSLSDLIGAIAGLRSRS